MTAAALHRRCHGKARGWAACRFGWGTDGFPRRGWWGLRPGLPPVYLGADADTVLRTFGAAHLPPVPSET